MASLDHDQMRSAAAEVQRAVDAYATSNTIADYKTLQTRVRQLQVATTKPSDLLFAFRLQSIENISVVMLLEMGVLDALVEKGGEATAEELASATKYDELFVSRLMRVACSLLFVDEVGDFRYRANGLTKMLVRPGWKGALQFAEDLYPIGAKIRSYLSDTGYGRPGASSGTTAYEFAAGRTIWKGLQDEPYRRKNFDLWMRERRLHEESHWTKRYPPCAHLAAKDLKQDPDAVLMVDVGGASGSQVRSFHAQFPNLPGRCILQDIDLRESNIRDANAEGVETMSYSFFTPQPVRGARFYYFRSVFHDWDDTDALKLLQNLVPAMEPGYSTILIDDYVLPTRDTQHIGGVEDVLMMVFLGALERTNKQYEQLLHRAGLEIINIYEVGGNEEALIEARLIEPKAPTNGVSS